MLRLDLRCELGLRLEDRDLDELLGARRERDLRRIDRLRFRWDHARDGMCELIDPRQAERLEDLAELLIAVVGKTRKPKEDVLRSDVLVPHADRLLIRQRKDPLGPGGEAVELGRAGPD